ncbi:MAG: 3-methyl-2-oxobutanoate dehydrogenase subunit VorB [Candidatus Krumholzibacteria bacterium]|jgi:pyruvate/2-oxoacid:ferredoxin oxidoreductase alpha subunit|nr:3-methyl-2-oxobutanoate dehydrogenase subunit VorB [Candidatus Krumholzibacteria bacterium]
MARQFMKGNDAIILGALAAGCRAYYGYPITPASEIAHAASLHFPALGGVFIQAESEVAAINMVYGTAGMGIRAMTASSSPGFSLKQEGLSYIAGAELPCVVVNIVRGGPGLGNIAPEQADYFQITKGGGHGNYRLIALAPNSAQEMCNLTMLAFDLADKYRNPACIMADGITGQMMEVVDIPEPKPIPFDHRSWAVHGDAQTRQNLISSIFLEPEELEKHNLKLDRKYREIMAHEVRHETYCTEDADLVVVAYGVTSRIVYSAIDQAREAGLKVGLLRPITIWPFPSQAVAEAAQKVKQILVVELSTGQMVEDVQLAVLGRCPVHFYGRCGGMVPSSNEILSECERILAGGKN